MAVLLDTSGLPPAVRAEAVVEVIRFSTGLPMDVVYHCPADQVSARFDFFTFGDARLLRSDNSSLELVATPAHLRQAERDVLSISVKQSGTATLSQDPGRVLQGGDLFVAQLWRPLEFADEGGRNSAFIPLDRLGLPRDYVEQAGRVLHLSPLAQQLRRHCELLFRDADMIGQGQSAAMIGQATTDLVRAALVTAADEEPLRSDGWEQSLLAVAKSYIDQHLADPGLGAEALARALFISVRQVYKLWETEPSSLGQWILERRLDAAKRELTSSRRRHQTIAAIAGRWGFVDATHFSRRFRLAYGMSPREWRHASAAARAATAANLPTIPTA